jgi:hypothetical protein
LLIHGKEGYRRQTTRRTFKRVKWLLAIAHGEELFHSVCENNYELGSGLVVDGKQGYRLCVRRWNCEEAMIRGVVPFGI